MATRKSRSLLIVGLIALVGLALFLVLTAPSTWRLLNGPRDLPDAGVPDLVNGRTQFIAGDCATCHASVGKGDETLLGGGRSLDTAFGEFHMPNISSHPMDGIGGYTVEQFIMAMREGVIPGKGNAYPAFPYTSYQRMTANDLRDLFAYIQSLPPVAGKVPDHDLKFPFSMRRGVGLWRLAFLDGKPLPEDLTQTAQWNRGRYLVEGSAHCVECHSPRNAMGAVPFAKRFSGGPNPEGTGHIPNISQDETGIGYWSVNDIARYLEEGVNPIGIKAGGDMKEVVVNTARLSESDRLAMAVYLKSLPGVEAPNAGAPRPNRTEEVVMLAAGQAHAGPSRLASLAASPDMLGKQDVLYVVSPTPFTLEANGTGEDGKLLGATRLAVLKREAGRMQVRVDGWQQDGSESAMYALKGQRIMQAVLSPEAIAKVNREKTERDEETGQDWHQGSLAVWILPTAGLSADLMQLWKHSDETYRQSCASCHALPHSEEYLANQWIGTLGAMKRYTSLDDAEYRLMLSWLQNHSKDVGPATQGGGHK